MKINFSIEMNRPQLPKLAALPFSWSRLAVPLLVIVSLVLSSFSVATVLSAPKYTAVGVPNTVGFEGFLAESNGQPIADGEYQLTFRIYSEPTGGSELWDEVHSAVQVTNGLYSVVLGTTDPFTTTTFDGTRYIGVQVGTGAEITPRTLVSSVPFALNASNSQKIGGGGVEGMVVAFDGPCPNGWTEFAAAQGRVVVGVPASGLLGGTVGTSLTDRENRTHTHTGGLHQHYSGIVLSGNQWTEFKPTWGSTTLTGDLSTQSMGEHNGTTLAIHSGPHTEYFTSSAGNVSTSADSSNIPYIQLRYCKLNGS